MCFPNQESNWRTLVVGAQKLNLWNAREVPRDIDPPHKTDRKTEARRRNRCPRVVEL